MKYLLIFGVVATVLGTVSMILKIKHHHSWETLDNEFSGYMNFARPVGILKMQYCRECGSVRMRGLNHIYSIEQIKQMGYPLDYVGPRSGRTS